MKIPCKPQLQKGFKIIELIKKECVLVQGIWKSRTSFDSISLAWKSWCQKRQLCFEECLSRLPTQQKEALRSEFTEETSDICLKTTLLHIPLWLNDVKLLRFLGSDYGAANLTASILVPACLHRKSSFLIVQ